MNRRGFLGSLATAAAALTLDPERLLWVPAKKTIFIPPSLATPTYDDLLAVTLKHYAAYMKIEMERETLLFRYFDEYGTTATYSTPIEGFLTYA